MPNNEFYLIRTVSGFQPATEQDLEACMPYKVGDVIRFMAQKPRNGKHHRKGFALLQLGFNYWEGNSSFLTAGEKNMASFLADKLDKMAGGSGVIVQAISELVKQKEKQRMDKIGVIEKSFNAYRKEVTIKAGFYDIERSPSGIKKHAHSLSYDRMPQESFNEWYKASFGIIWNETLSKHFASEKEADDAANNMLEYI